MIPLGLNKALASVSPGPQSPAPLPSWAGCSIPLPRGQLSYTHVLHKWTQQTIKEPIALCWQLILGQSWQLGITKSLLVLWPWLCGSQSGAGHSHTLLLCSNSSVLRAIASGHEIFFHSGVGSSSYCSAEQMEGRAWSLSPQAVTSPESWSQQGHKNNCQHLREGFTRRIRGWLGTALLLSEIQGLADHNGWHKAKSKQLPKDVALEKTVSWQVLRSLTT